MAAGQRCQGRGHGCGPGVRGTHRERSVSLARQMWLLSVRRVWVVDSCSSTRPRLGFRLPQSQTLLSERERGMIEGGMARRRVMADSAPGCLLVQRGLQGKGIDRESGGGMRGCGMEQETEVERGKGWVGGEGGSGKVGECGR